MEFGLFDHLDRNDRPDAELYADRLAIIEATDAAGGPTVLGVSDASVFPVVAVGNVAFNTSFFEPVTYL